MNLLQQAEVLQGIGLNLGDPEYQAAYAWMEDYRGKLNKVVTKIPLPGRNVSNLGAVVANPTLTIAAQALKTVTKALP
jgi:hypothetical protein